MVGYMTNKKTTHKKPVAAKKKAAAKKPVAKKKASSPSVKRVEIDVPTADDVKDLVSDTLAELQRNNFKVDDAIKKGFFARVKSWFKVS
jgi:hypothetical protein